MTMTQLDDDTPTTPWQGDWRQRLESKLKSLGFEGLEDFLLAYQGVGYVKLAERLEDANVAAMQLCREHIRRGSENSNLRSVAKDSLVRFLNEYARRGWKVGRHFPHRSASAFAAWSTSLASHSTSSIEFDVKRVFDELEALPIPNGWLPTDSSDRFIVEAFNRGWPMT
jgi:hypothetical protein